MGPLKVFSNLEPRTRALVGVGVITWGLIGINLSNVAEKKLGYEPTDLDRARLREGLPSHGGIAKVNDSTEAMDKEGER